MYLSRFILSIILVFGQSNLFAQDKYSDNNKVVNYIPSLPQKIFPKIVSNSSKEKIVSKKKEIDSTAVREWMGLSEKVSISNDGKYFYYSIKNHPFNSNTLIVKSAKESWESVIVGVPDGGFSGNSELFFYLESDTLFFLRLGTSEKTFVPNVHNYTFSSNGNGKWLLYQVKKPQQTLIAFNLLNGEKQQFHNIVNFKFDDDSGRLIIQTMAEHGMSAAGLQFVNLENKIVTNIWSVPTGSRLVNYTADFTRNQFCWIEEDSSESNGIMSYKIWYYDLQMVKPIVVVNNQSPGIEDGLSLSALSLPRFTRDGRHLCFWLYEEELPKPNSNAVQVDIWNYLDSELQSMQLLKISKGVGKEKFQAVVPVNNFRISSFPFKVIRLLQKDEIPAAGHSWDMAGDYFLIKERRTSIREEEINNFWLISMKDGSRKLIETRKEARTNFWFSPHGRYLLKYGNDHQFYCYDLKRNMLKMISAKLDVNWNLENEYLLDSNGNYHIRPVGVAGWVGEEQKVLIYDNYDLWMIDLTGKKEAVNISKGYGRQNKLRIRLVEEGRVFDPNDTMLLSVFNSYNKFNGLCRAFFHSERSFEEPEIGPWSIYYTKDANSGATAIINGFMRPIRAKNANVWIVKRESSTEAPNYYLTQDFKKYDQLTNLQPHYKYNWLNAELLQFRQIDGSNGQGVLYTPEDFDPKKKYPLIFSYYEQNSGFLHQYPSLEFMYSSRINIPWFVSRGYLVFAPDIYYRQGRMVESVCNTMVAAAKTLALLPYVDGQRMGIASFSWGGTQTNWLITQTNLFAAAATGGTGAAGSDLISVAFQVREIRGVKEDAITGNVEETLGGSFWSNPKKWLDISPILRCDKVTTPLLMMQNYGDYNWQQSAEIFLALRRLKKKVWMLQYDKGGHGVYGKDAEDFTIRITQFFDHFLKGKAEPRWMEKGIPAKLKGIDNGYELSTKQNLPKS